LIVEDPNEAQVHRSRAERMQAAQKARWAKVRGESSPVTAITNAAKPKSGINAAGRKALSIAIEEALGG